MKTLMLKCIAVALLVSSASAAWADEIVYDNDWRAAETSLITHGGCSTCQNCGWY